VPPQPIDAADAESPAVAVAGELATIDAPMLGTFYRAQAPGAPPFVEIGAPVEEHTVVCLIEVMKMMNAVHAGVSGTIVEVCVENAVLVELGTPLFRVQPER
jgi:acetyl-CoA carboxylase biotin carboxyl carrier protein